jgi:16S rRNA (cytosine1402-N4)-methyltransferase
MLARGARVIAFDRDPDAVREGQLLVDESGECLTLVPERFSRMRQALSAFGIASVDGVALDLGVSSMQLDRPDRGFSFQSDGPLDMRMERVGRSAAQFLNEADEAEIADVLFHYGEEPKSRRIARAIVAARPIERTGQLADIVRRAVGMRPGARKDPATRAFQAIRIHLNQELEEIEEGLVAAEEVLKPGGRLAVVTGW